MNFTAAFSTAAFFFQIDSFLLYLAGTLHLALISDLTDNIHLCYTLHLISVLWVDLPRYLDVGQK